MVVGVRWRDLLSPAVSRAVTVETRPVSDPGAAAWLELTGGANPSGEPVTEHSALSYGTFWRCVHLISGVAADLPLRTYTDPAAPGDARQRQRVPSILDNPGGVLGLVPYVWARTVLLHMAIHGEAFLRVIRAGGGQVLGLEPIHPLAVTDVTRREVAPGLWTKAYTVKLEGGGDLEAVGDEMLHVMWATTDGLRGISPISTLAAPLGTALAGMRAGANGFRNGLQIGGLVSSDETVTPDEADDIVEEIKRKSGPEHAGDIIYINRPLKFDPWTLPPKDAELLASREYSTVEIVGAMGVPPHLAGVLGAVSNWGTGVREQNRQLGSFTLRLYTSPLEQVVSTVLRAGRWAEFDYSGLLAGTPDEEINLLIAQVGAGILTVDEARAIRDLPPLDTATTDQPADDGEPADA